MKEHVPKVHSIDRHTLSHYCQVLTDACILCITFVTLLTDADVVRKLYDANFVDAAITGADVTDDARSGGWN